MEAIKVDKLTKYYGKARGVIDLDLCVEESEFFGFIGPNGAGKSTTIRTMLGLIQPSGGNVALLGNTIMGGAALQRNKRVKTVLEEIGYLPSEAIFYRGMRVREVLKLSADLRKKDCSEEAAVLCERLQLEPSKRVEALSFGNRKKVGIICALQHKPRLVILDEPTSGLDPLMQREFFAILQERNREGTTIFLSSHILSEIQHYCNRAAIIREGKLVACDSVEALSKTSTKRVTIHGKVDLNGLEGICDKRELDNGISFLYAGDINKLIMALSQCSIADLTVAEPDLEEIFMHYYGA